MCFQSVPLIFLSSVKSRSQVHGGKENIPSKRSKGICLVRQSVCIFHSLCIEQSEVSTDAQTDIFFPHQD